MEQHFSTNTIGKSCPAEAGRVLCHLTAESVPMHKFTAKIVCFGVFWVWGGFFPPKKDE